MHNKWAQHERCADSRTFMSRCLFVSSSMFTSLPKHFPLLNNNFINHAELSELWANHFDVLCCSWGYLSLTFCYILVKEGSPSDEELETLSQKIAEGWRRLGRRLKMDESKLTAFDKENDEYSEKPYKMLLCWKQREGSAATYQVLCEALCHPLVNRRGLAEEICGNKWLRVPFTLENPADAFLTRHFVATQVVRGTAWCNTPWEERVPEDVHWSQAILSNSTGLTAFLIIV